MNWEDSKNIVNGESVIIRELEEIYTVNFKESETVEFKKSISELDSALKNFMRFFKQQRRHIIFWN